MRLNSVLACLMAGVSLTLAGAVAAHDHDGKHGDRFHARKPLIGGHRGAPGYLPDHTIEGYTKAIEMGADFIEPDLVVTKDGVLVARHEPNIIGTTDVTFHPEFASRKRVAIVDGAAEEGFFVSDFTLAELKTIHAIQPPAERPQQYNGKFDIPTFEEVIALAKKMSRKTGRQIGIYPETKHPTYHQQLGLPLEGRLIKALEKAGWNHRHAPVFIQSFETANLKKLRHMTDVRLIQLIDADDVNANGSLAFNVPFYRPYDWTASGKPELLARTFGYLTTDAGLREVAKYADGISPWKRYIVSTVPDASAPVGAPGESARKTLPPTDLIQRAHKQGLLVHTWTFRNEPRHLASNYGGNPLKEYQQFFKLGIDGVFSDFTDTAVEARRRLR